MMSRPRAPGEHAVAHDAACLMYVRRASRHACWLACACDHATRHDVRHVTDARHATTLSHARAHALARPCTRTRMRTLMHVITVRMTHAHACARQHTRTRIAHACIHARAAGLHTSRRAINESRLGHCTFLIHSLLRYTPDLRTVEGLGSVSPSPCALISTTGGSSIRAGGVTHTRPTRTGALSTLGNHPLVRCPNEQCQRARGPPKCGMLPPPDSLGGSRRLSCNGETRGLNTHRIRSCALQWDCPRLCLPSNRGVTPSC